MAADPWRCKPSSRGDFAARIIAAVARTIEAIYAVGDELLAAKAALPHGEFLAMRRRDLPFGERQAQRYMAIAQHDGLRNPTFRSLLPASVTLLYQLSRIEPDELMPLLRKLQKYKDKEPETQVFVLLQDLGIRKALDAPPVTCQGVQAEVNKIAERANADVQATHPTNPEPPADAPEPQAHSAQILKGDFIPAHCAPAADPPAADPPAAREGEYIPAPRKHEPREPEIFGQSDCDPAEGLRAVRDLREQSERAAFLDFW